MVEVVVVETLLVGRATLASFLLEEQAVSIMRSPVVGQITFTEVVRVVQIQVEVEVDRFKAIIRVQ